MSEKDRVFETMYDGGEEDQDDSDLTGDNDDSENQDDAGDSDQEYLEVFGNKYSLDDDGKSKLIEDAKNFETAYHDSRREVADIKELLKREDKSGEEGKKPDEDDLPFDVSDLSKEDQEAVKMLQNLISSQTEQQIEKIMKPFIDSQVDREIKEELQEIEDVYGKFDRDELLKYAHKNHLEENLMAAYKDMNFDKQINVGRKLEADDRERKKGSGLPSGSSKGGNKVPKYNKEEHGKMNFREILEKFM